MLLLLALLASGWPQQLKGFPTFEPCADATTAGGTSYVPGAALAGQTNAAGESWYGVYTASLATPVTVTNVPLSYPGLPPSSGNSVVLRNVSGPGARMFLATNASGFFYTTNPATLFYSLILQARDISNLSSNGDYNIGFSTQTSITNLSSQVSIPAGRLYFKKVGGSYQIGIAKGSTTVAYDPTLHSTNEVLFIVAEYEIVYNAAQPLSTDDNVRLWVNPPASALGAALAPPETVSLLGATVDSSTITSFSLLQRSLYTPNVLLVDEIRLGTNWTYVTGGPTTLRVLPPVTNVPYGGTLSLAAAFNATGGSPLSYQWLKDGAPLVDGGAVSGAATTNLVISNLAGVDAGTYAVIVQTADKSFTNSASVTVADPAITLQPASGPFSPGSTVSLQVGAVGSPPLSFQWQFNGTNLADNLRISGTTSNVLVLANAQTTSAGAYTVVVTGAAGSVTSAPAFLLPYIPQPPPAGGELATGEYFWDTDPGEGQGASLSLPAAQTLITGDALAPPLNVDVSTLTVGRHQLGFRLQDTDGRWGDVTWLPIQVQDGLALVAAASWPPVEPNNWLLTGEYFWDADPGPGNGAPASVPAGETFVLGDLNAAALSADVSQLSPGSHRLGFRAKDAGGRWGDVTWLPVRVQDGLALVAAATWPPVESNTCLVAAEYFWDAAPEPDNGAPLAVPAAETFILGDTNASALSADVSQLPAGTHRLGIRAKDASGRWGDITWSPVMVQDGLNLVAAATWPPVESNTFLLTGEYFWDTDPGVGFGSPISFPAGETYAPNSGGLPPLKVPVPHLPLGLHHLGLRVQDAAGNWSATTWTGVILDRQSQFTLANAITVLTSTNTSTFAIPTISCPGSSQLCASTFDVPLQTASLLLAQYTANPVACADVRIHFLVDGTELAATARLSAGAASGWFSLGPLSAGSHLLQLQAEGFVGGCDAGALSSWSGLLQLTTTALSTNVAGGDFSHWGGLATGVAAADFDRDGLPDVFETYQDQGGLLLKDDASGALNRTNPLLPSAPSGGQTAVWADYDNDGWPDLFVATSDRSVTNRNLLYHNLGGTNFALLDLTSLPSAESNSVGCAWADVDSDGFVDLAVASTNGTPISLYHNNGDGTFALLTNNTGLVSGAAQAVAFGDFNNDGLPDLVTAGAGGVHLFRNLAGSQFMEVTNSGLADDLTAQSVAWGDFDNDGWLDLFIASSSHLGALFRNNHDGTFTQLQFQTFNQPGFSAAACAWGDFDQDGRLDLFVTSGATNFSNQLFHNNGDGSFTPQTNGPAASPAALYAGCAWADLDANGTPDLLIAGAGVTNLLYRNTGSGANWLKVKLSGRPSNRCAIGAKLHLLANIDGQNLWQMREISGGNGYGSQNELTANFGLGDATNVDSLQIQWPSGLTTVFTNVAFNQVLAVQELPEGTPVIEVNRTFSASGQFHYVSLDPVTVTIDSPFLDGWVFYTTDGSEPDFTANWYTGPFEISPPATLQAIAYDAGLSLQATSAPVQLVLVPTFFVTNSTPGGGDFTLSPPGPNYLSGTEVAAVATNLPGWTFLGWGGALSGSDPTNIFVVSSNQDITAVFGTPLSVSTLGGTNYGAVTVEPKTNLYPCGTLARLSALPAPGKYFVNWGLAGSSTSTLTNNPMDWPVTTATPSLIARLGNLPTNSFSLTTLISGQGSVTRSSFAGYYTNGAAVTLTAVPVSGQFFLGWSGDVTSPQNPLTVVMDSSKVVTANFGLLPPRFWFNAAGSAVNEADGSVSLTVLHEGIAGVVSYTTLDGTAVGGNGSSGDYLPAHGTLSFTNAEVSKTFSIGIRDNFLVGPDRQFQVQLRDATGGTNALGTPSTATITIHYNDAVSTNGSLLVQAFPEPMPDRSGSLRVTLLPGGVGGQWRFPWELGWRNSGESVTNLAEDNYELEFRQLPGYSIPELPPQLVLTNAPTTEVTNQYSGSGQSGLGWLTVNLGPNVVTNAGWRLLGESGWREPGTTATGLAPGSQLIEFKPVSGLSTPSAREVQVFANEGSLVWGYYLVAAAPATAAALPSALPALPAITSSLTNSPRLPYAFNGQLQSEVGFGSGVAVQPNVVLTAAHVVFNDATLSYVSQVNWFFQKQAGEFEPKPLPARGWYVLSGYADQRTADLTNGYAPGVSSAASRNWDVAALYFLSPAARFGFGGYLESDAALNPYLTSTNSKLLVGYPVDGASFGSTNVVAGQMHAVPARNYGFTLQNDQVYTSPDFLSFPGNSGGPLYVLHTNNIYYPAAVYLGTLSLGMSNVSVVRALDSNAVNLIHRAAALGDAGTNFTGGGVVTITTGQTGIGSLPWLRVNLGPSTALTAGAGWKLQTDADWWAQGTTAADQTRALPSGSSSVVIQFKPITGWTEPPASTLQVAPGQTTVVTGSYLLAGTLVLGPAGSWTASGYVGGPFIPGTFTCWLTNAGSASLSWTASKTAGWLSVSPAGGTLAGGAWTNVVLTINANASSQPAGAYTDSLCFSNQTTGLGNLTRSISLNVAPHPPVQFLNPQAMSDGSIVLTLRGVTNGVYAVLTTTNLLTPTTNWTEVLRLTNTAGQISFTNAVPRGAAGRYYRAREL